MTKYDKCANANHSIYWHTSYSELKKTDNKIVLPWPSIF